MVHKVHKWCHSTAEEVNTSPLDNYIDLNLTIFTTKQSNNHTTNYVQPDPSSTPLVVTYGTENTRDPREKLVTLLSERGRSCVDTNIQNQHLDYGI